MQSISSKLGVLKWILSPGCSPHNDNLFPYKNFTFVCMSARNFIWKAWNISPTKKLTRVNRIFREANIFSCLELTFVGTRDGSIVGFSLGKGVGKCVGIALGGIVGIKLGITLG